MLTVILTVLKVIGLILLILLGTVLGLLLLILFMPVVYRASAVNRDEEHLLKGLKAEAKIRWFFGLLRAGFAYPEPGRLVVKVLFFTVFDSGKDDREITAGQEITSEQEAAESKDTTAPEEFKVPAGQSETSADDVDQVKTPAGRSETSADKMGVENEEASPEKGLHAKFDKFKYTIHDTCGRIKDVWENFSYYKDVFEQDDTKQLLKHVFKRLGRILKSIRPRKLNANIRFGTGSPDTTGYAYGVYGMLCSVLGKNVFVAPDFERAVLTGSVYAAGHITLFTILWHGLMVVIDKKLWGLISKLKHRNAKNETRK